MVAVDVAVLCLALLIILIGAELFTNAIEWFGHKLGIAEGAVGSVLAAVGTAMPETMIPLIAILFTTGGSGDEIGVGAILGAPFMLATLAMFVTGVAVLVRGRGGGDKTVRADQRTLVHDLRYFAACYGVAISVAFLPPDLVAVRWAVALGLFGAYALYVKAHFEADRDADAANPNPLRLRRFDRTAHRSDPDTPRLRIVSAQVLFALGCVIAGAYAFVGAVSGLARQVGLDETLLALVVAPIATELPEKINSVIWIRQRKDTLALGNITGAMVFQSAIPTGIALLFAGTAWSVSADSTLAFASAGIAILSTFVIFGIVRSGAMHGRRLLTGGLFYVLYVALVVTQLAGKPA